MIALKFDRATAVFLVDLKNDMLCLRGKGATALMHRVANAARGFGTTTFCANLCVY